MLRSSPRPADVAPPDGMDLAQPPCGGRLRCRTGDIRRRYDLSSAPTVRAASASAASRASPTSAAVRVRSGARNRSV